MENSFVTPVTTTIAVPELQESQVALLQRLHKASFFTHGTTTIFSEEHEDAQGLMEIGLISPVGEWQSTQKGGSFKITLIGEEVRKAYIVGSLANA